MLEPFNGFWKPSVGYKSDRRTGSDSCQKGTSLTVKRVLKAIEQVRSSPWMPMKGLSNAVNSLLLLFSSTTEMVAVITRSYHNNRSLILKITMSTNYYYYQLYCCRYWDNNIVVVVIVVVNNVVIVVIDHHVPCHRRRHPCWCAAVPSIENACRKSVGVGDDR